MKAAAFGSALLHEKRRDTHARVRKSDHGLCLQSGTKSWFEKHLMSAEAVLQGRSLGFGTDGLRENGEHIPMLHR